MKKEYYVILMAMLYLTSCSPKVLTLADLEHHKASQNLDEIQFFISAPLVLEPVDNASQFDINGIEKDPNYRLKYPKGWAGIYGNFAEKGLYKVWDEENVIWSLRKNPYLEKDSIFVVEEGLVPISRPVHHLVEDDMETGLVSGRWSLTTAYQIYETAGRLHLVQNPTPRLPTVVLPSNQLANYAPQYSVYQSASDQNMFLIKDQGTIHKPDPFTFQYPIIYAEQKDAIFIEYGDDYGLWFAPNSAGEYELLTLNGLPAYRGVLVQTNGGLYERIGSERVFLNYKQKRNIFRQLFPRRPRQERIGNNIR